MSHFDQFNQLDTNKAKATGGGKYIDRTGKYIGKFKQAVCFEALSGAKGIEFEFVSTNGEQTSFSIYTVKKDGEESFGANQVHAIMACMRKRSATVAMQKANVWDSESKSRKEQLKPQLTGLLDSPIGILLEKEEYLDGNGKTRYRMNFKHPFEAATELMADELLAGKQTPERLPDEVARLKDQVAKPQTSASPFNGNKQDERNPPAAAFDDDIPF